MNEMTRIVLTFMESVFIYNQNCDYQKLKKKYVLGLKFQKMGKLVNYRTVIGLLLCS